jgi:hypothetical protein
MYSFASYLAASWDPKVIEIEHPFDITTRKLYEVPVVPCLTTRGKRRVYDHSMASSYLYSTLRQIVKKDSQEADF